MLHTRGIYTLFVSQRRQSVRIGFFFQAEDGIRDLVRSRGLGDVYKRQAYAIAHSPLVKTAFFASDPNLGRILAAVGYAGIGDLDQGLIDLFLDDVHVVHAVSYTHLRAHETVLDLVCRLLLEKKKHEMRNADTPCLHPTSPQLSQLLN